jgi:hypothetical protein
MSRGTFSLTIMCLPLHPLIHLPVTRTMVSRPDRSVTCTNVSLKDANMCATPNTSSPSRTCGPSEMFSSTLTFFPFLPACHPKRRPGNNLLVIKVPPVISRLQSKERNKGKAVDYGGYLLLLANRSWSVTRAHNSTIVFKLVGTLSAVRLFARPLFQASYT